MQVQLIFDTFRTKERFLWVLRKRALKKKYSPIVEINFDGITRAIRQALREIQVGR